jgi:phage gp29-like protein
MQFSGDVRVPGQRTTGWISVLKSLGSLLGGREPKPSDSRRIVLPWREDSLRTHPSVGLTPSRALALLQAADAGWPQAQFELFDEMLQKWPRLASVEATRRLALTGLAWDVAPDQNAARADGRLGRQEALRVAEYCRAALDRLERLHEVLDHLATAVGYGIAVAEIVWEDGRLADLVPVPHGRLISDPHEPWRLRVRTEEEPNLGVALDEHPFKWIVHQPRCRRGRPFEGGLLRASALLYLAQNLGLKDWLVYSQVAGMPIRVAQFAPGTPDADKKQLLRILESLGTDAVAVLSNTVDLKFVEAGSAGEKPYKPIQEYCNTEVTILWLGQHLTTDIRTSGSRAAAEVHDRVREDLLVDDMRDEASTLRRDLLTPMVRARFGDGAPVPHFRRSLVESVDTKVLADTLAVAVRDLGLAGR